MENNKQQLESLADHLKALKNKKLWLWFALEMFFAGLYLAFDLLTKEFIYGRIERTGEDMILWKGVLRFTAVQNTGASFGLFSDGTTFLAVISTIAAVALLFLLVVLLPNRNPWLRASLVLMFAGGIGNLVDRFAFGYVRDFVYFELIDFAVFNFADSALCVGAACLLIYVFFFYGRKGKERARREKQGADAPPSGADPDENGAPDGDRDKTEQ